MNAGLIISTYNSPRFLQLILASVEIQSRRPDQVMIADDGSTAETRHVVDSFRDRTRIPTVHCWQPDHGHRKTRVMNRAIVRADTDYLISIDGDMVLHPRFVEDHCVIAKPGRYTQGRRVCMNDRATQRHLASGNPRVRWFKPGVNRRPQMIRSYWLMKRLSRVDQSLKNSRGCNQAFWRQDLLDVNGYEEKITGWGREDTEICVRLHHLGRHRIYARHLALAYHLDHPQRSRERDECNLQIVADTVRSGRIRALRGIAESLRERGAAA